MAEGNGTIRALQGGTDLFIRMRAGAVEPQRLVDLKGLPGMTDIRRESDGRLVIGAACTLNQVSEHPEVVRDYNLLTQACNAVASYQIRNRATLGGNCCNASPAADTVPALRCLEATAEICGPDGSRCLPVAEFICGPGRTALRSGEFLTCLQLPPPPKGARGVFNKMGRTRLGDIALVNVAIFRWQDGTASGTAWRIVLGSVGPTSLRASAAEDALAWDTGPVGVANAGAWRPGRPPYLLISAPALRTAQPWCEC